MKGLIENLLFVNCRHNYKIESDGACRSTTCMLNQDPETKEKVKKYGCKIFKEAEKSR